MSEAMKNPYTLAHLALSAQPGETIEAAGVAGFAAVGIRICARRPGEPWASPLIGDASAIRAMKRTIADAGVRLSNVSAYQFYPEVTWDHIAPVIDTVAELGAPIIVANSFNPDEPRFVALLARYAEKAAAAGIRIAVEFLPYSRVRNLDQTLRVVAATGAPNAGVLLDALHLDRSHGTPDDIARVAPERIVFAQLCDAKKLAAPLSDEQLLQEARTARLPAGEGDLPLFDFLDALPSGIEIEYEVARADMSAASPVEKALAARRDADRFLERYEAHRTAAARVAQ